MADTAMGLDYSLSGDTLNRIKNAGVTRVPETGIGEAISGIGETITDYATEGQDAMAGWDEGFAIQGDRGSWASGELFDQFQQIEEQYKNEYLAAVKSKDKQAQSRLLSDQGKRAAGLQSWKDTMETAKKINDGVGWGERSLDESEKNILNTLSRNDGSARVRISDNGEMVFDIPGKNGKITSVTRREVDSMIAKGTKPLDLELKFLETNEGFVNKGLNGELFDYENLLRRNRLSIDDDQLNGLMNEQFGGGESFREHIKSHEDFKQVPIWYEGGDRDGNGTVDMYDLTPEEMDMVVDQMQREPSVAKDYVSEWMTKIQQANWKKGADEKASRDASKKSNNTRDTRTTYEKNLDRDVRDRRKMIEARSKPLVIGGKEWGYVSVDRYFKDENGDWVWNNNPEGANPVIKKVEDHVKKRGGDYRAIIAELERLQPKTSSTPSGTSSTSNFGG